MPAMPLADFTFATGAGRVAGRLPEAVAVDPLPPACVVGCVAAPPWPIFIAVQLASVITAAVVTIANADCFI
jgi:hypothetical protein